MSNSNYRILKLKNMLGFKYSSINTKPQSRIERILKLSDVRNNAQRSSTPPPENFSRIDVGPINLGQKDDKRTYLYDKNSKKFFIVSSKDREERGMEVGIDNSIDLYLNLISYGIGAGIDDARVDLSSYMNENPEVKDVITKHLGKLGTQITVDRSGKPVIIPYKPPAGGVPDSPATTTPSSGTISAAGLERLKRAEGKVLKAYKDSSRISIAYGNTYYPPNFIPIIAEGKPNTKPLPAGRTHNNGKGCGNNPCVRFGDQISDAQAEQILKYVIKDFEKAVKQNITAPITQNQFDALVIFAYNIGVGALGRSQAVKLINKSAEPKQIWMAWSAQPGVKSRRKLELEMYFYGKY